MSDFTKKQREALNAWARTQPSLRSAFDYTDSQGVPGEAPPSNGLGDRLSAPDVKPIPLPFVVRDIVNNSDPINANTWADVEWNSYMVFGDYAVFSGVNGEAEMTCLESGLYTVEYRGRFSQNNTGYRSQRFVINGIGHGNDNRLAVSGAPTDGRYPMTHYIGKGSVLKIQVRHTANSPIFINKPTGLYIYQILSSKDRD